SGVLGLHMAEALQAAGHEVTGIGRNGASDRMRALGVPGVAADLMDRDGLLRAVDGHQADVVIHAATALRKAPMRQKDMYATDDLRIAGTANLLAAASAVGATRFVSESMMFGYGYRDFGDKPVTEDELPWAPKGPSAGLERTLAGFREKEAL